MNIIDQIFAASDPQALAVVTHDAQRTYAQLALDVEKTAGILAKSNAHRMALDCPDGLQHIILALAILRVDKCMIPVPREWTHLEQTELLRTTGCEALLREDGSLTPLSVKTPIGFPEEEFKMLHPAFIRFSSGTTGKSKGVVISHATLLERVRAANRGLQIKPGDRILWILPMAHHFAVSIILYLLHGATVLLPKNHQPETLLSLAETESATVLYGSPFHYRFLSASPIKRQWPSLRLAVSTASPLPKSTADAFRARFGLAPSQAYGIIEVGLPCINLHDADTHPESVGKPLPDFKIQIHNESLRIAGPGIFDAYLSPWQTRAHVLEDGWFRTGDMGHFDADGRLYLDGRTTSVINIGGLKFFPEEVESVLLLHPEISAVRVIARPHPQTGSIPIAEIVTHTKNLSIAELIRHCRNHLATYKIPVDFLFVDALPLTPSGKIRRATSSSSCLTPDPFPKRGKQIDGN